MTDQGVGYGLRKQHPGVARRVDRAMTRYWRYATELAAQEAAASERERIIRRDARIVESVRSGEDRAAVAKRFGITRNHLRQILFRAGASSAGYGRGDVELLEAVGELEARFGLTFDGIYTRLVRLRRRGLI